MPSSMYKRKKTWGSSQSAKKVKGGNYGTMQVYGRKRKPSFKGLYMNPRIHRFTRMAEQIYTISVTAGALNDGLLTSPSLSLEFSLSGVQTYLGGAAGAFASFNPGDLTALFDQYRIDAIEITIMAQGDPNTFTASGSLPRFYICNDYDDSNAVGSLAQIQSQQGVKVFQPGPIERSYTHWVNPRILTQTYRTALTTGYAPAQMATWIDCSQDNVPHYGVKLWSAGEATVSGKVTFCFRAYISAKNQC